MLFTGGRLKSHYVAEARKSHREKRLLPPVARADCRGELTFYRTSINMAECHDGGGG